MNNLIVVFARAPVAGRCKTRLIPKCGAAGAARVHRQLARRTLATACGVSRAEVELWCAPDAGHGFFHASRQAFNLRLRRQSSGDLGRRMSTALMQSLRHASKVIVIGTDCAVLTTADIEAALHSLDSHDAVLQPAEDGGYVLIGARRFSASALHGIDWSSGREYAQTQQGLQRAGLSVATLATRWDVDTPGDLNRARHGGVLLAYRPV